ncbi:MAG: short-chain dehydrogenase [Gammaproteobacteria bacterium]|nr:MAG: short-chain dehydrogenase [Gammaproteobacteria bacterium]
MARTVLITGANRGLGIEFVKQYLGEAWDVLACCRSPESASQLMDLASRHHEQLQIIPMDVADLSSVNGLGKQLKGQKIDLIINNAGAYCSSGVFGKDAIDVAAWQHSFAVNTIGPIKVVEALLDNLTQGEGKSIALITSKMGSVSDNSSGGSYLYRSSKAALNAAGKSLAMDLAGLGIHVGIYHPGWVKTDMGGSNALITASQSVSGIRTQIADLGAEKSGGFYSYDGQLIAW